MLGSARHCAAPGAWSSARPPGIWLGEAARRLARRGRPALGLARPPDCEAAGSAARPTLPAGSTARPRSPAARRLARCGHPPGVCLGYEAACWQGEAAPRPASGSAARPPAGSARPPALARQGRWIGRGILGRDGGGE
jgi:hypothetical protein